MFQAGNEWLKFDFHLHTVSDTSYKYNGRDFVRDFVTALSTNGIRLAAITNHNLFNKEEFTQISQKAEKEQILILPGCELSVNDGKYGLHLLLIFNQNIISGDQDGINEFLTMVYQGRECFDENGKPKPCPTDLKGVLEKLETFGREYIAIAAHVDNSRGFFTTFSPARIHGFITDDIFRKQLLAFQDINFSSRSTFERLLREKFGQYSPSHLPAYVSFSDAKSVDDIGKKASYIKIGDFDFTAIHFAFLNHELRICTEPEAITYPAIHKISIESGNFAESIECNLNSGLNNLIGIRGSGKSAIIETVRWALGLNPMPFDKKYKKDLVNHALGNGGKITLEVTAQTGYRYIIEKTAGDAYEKVYDQDHQLTNLRAIGNIFDVLYFGQKDLAEHARDTGKLKLIDEYLKSELRTLQEREDVKLRDVQELVDDLKELEKHDLNLEQLKLDLAEKNEQLRTFKAKKVDRLLREQTDFEKDEVKYNQVKHSVADVKEELHSLVVLLNERFDAIKTTEFQKISSTVKNVFEELRTNLLGKISDMESDIEDALKTAQAEIQHFNRDFEMIKEKLRTLKSQFDKEKLDLHFYIKTEREIERLNIKIQTLETQAKKRTEIHQKLRQRVDELNGIRRERYEMRQKKAREIGQQLPFLELSVDYRGDAETLLDFLKDLCKGLGITEKKQKLIAGKFTNGFDLYTAAVQSDSLLTEPLTENEFSNFAKRIRESLYRVVTFQVNDKLVIRYKVGDTFKKIEELSLGQRAAALLAIILAEGDKPILIDQPEDDIDNNTIYEGIIKTLFKSKACRQFIFATHNSNIVVLGDSDNVIVCRSEKDKLTLTPQSGSIDKSTIQKEIVNIMEGGKEAFEKRKQIYKMWR